MPRLFNLKRILATAGTLVAIAGAGLATTATPAMAMKPECQAHLDASNDLISIDPEWSEIEFEAYLYCRYG
jgi:hypothetical protein